MAPLFANNSEFIKDLMQVLDIDPAGIRGFTLRAYVNELVVIEIEKFAEINSDHTIIKRWKITKEEEVG